MKIHFYFMAFIVMLAASCDKASFSKHEKSSVNNVQLKSPEAIKSEDHSLAVSDEDAATADTSKTQLISQQIVPQSGNTPNDDWDKKIIKTANIDLELKDYTLFNTKIHTGLKAYGAYISTEDQQSNDDKIENKITIKVPVDQFENLINTFSGEGIKVLEKNITSDDVTGEVEDTKARLQAKMEVRDRYLELLKEAHSMKDILAVQDEINSIQEDIESADGRVNFLQHESAYSTVNLNYYQFLTTAASENNAPTFLNKLKLAFNDGTSVVSAFVLFFISVWPLIVAVIITFIFIKQWKNKKVIQKTA